MSDSPCSLFDQPCCTACDPRVPATPLSLSNRPGLSKLHYRIGTFSVFRQAMLDAISAGPVSSADPANSAQARVLSCRSSDDFGIAILELWAYVCDVLTFYQQALANEAFLRTAQLRESLAGLAALLGYEPARGVAAAVLLAFLADKGASLTLPPGLRTQSIPPPGQDAATFENSAGLAISEAANQLTLLGPLAPAPTNMGELLPPGDAGGPSVVPGSKLVFYSTSAATVAEQVVSAVTPTSLGGKLVRWLGNVNGGAGVTVSRFGRKFRSFGANAPASLLTSTDATNWALSSTDFSIAAGSQLFLDASYDGIAAGSQVLVFDAAAPRVVVATVLGVVQGKREVDTTDSPARLVLSGSCTVLNVDVTMSFSDLRQVTFFELLGDDLPFRSQINSGDIPSGAETIFITDGSAIHKGAKIILVSGANSDVVTVSSQPPPGLPSPCPISITPALSNTYVPSKTTLYANVTDATQGQTQPEQVLGDGDASQPFQEFPLSISPVTYVPDPAADRGATSTLQVFVDDFEWTEVPSFFGRGPDETIYTTRVDESGKMFVRFGDGVTGRRLSTGSQNVRAHLRQGLGSSGNVAARTITILLQSLPGLKAVINPLAGFGGADPETLANIRDNAPISVITLGRAVSLNDYEALALSYNGVGKARASWGDFGGRRGVALTIAASGGKPLDQLTEPLRAFLDLHRDPNVPLGIVGYDPVHFVFRATLHLLAGFKQSSVKAAAQTAFGPDQPGGYLNFANLQFGDTVFQSQLIRVLQEVPGVDWVELRQFSVPASAVGHGFGDPLQLEAVYIGPQEIARPSLDDSDTPAVDLQYRGGVNDL